MKTVRTKGIDLNPGDIVQLFEDAYGTATVLHCTETEIELFRPYVHTNKFTSHRAIPYIGIEQFKASRNGYFDVISFNEEY